ncbi:unnamed protein product [Calicophoron daubneyi]|uniref:Uncharacterized protein n=1 Tax=Calicophoron daubneyi TaxID=300641 RepID=A0AAV2T7X3_CALDB
MSLFRMHAAAPPPLQWLYVFLLFWCGSVHCHLLSPCSRQYRNFILDQKTGYIRRMIEFAVQEQLQLPPRREYDVTGTAIPYSLEQLLRTYGHAVVDSSWHVHELAPVVHLDMLWPSETNHPISLPCWAPTEAKLIQLNETTTVSHRREWRVGQGKIAGLSKAESFGYRTEPASGALLVSPFMAMSYEHSGMTCTIGERTPKGQSSKVKFSQTHMLLYQTTNEQLLMKANAENVTVVVELELSAPDNDGPACRRYDFQEDNMECRDSKWMNSYYLRPEGGYTYYDAGQLNYNPKEFVYEEVHKIVENFCKLYDCTIVKPPHPKNHTASNKTEGEFNMNSVKGFFGFVEFPEQRANMTENVQRMKGTEMTQHTPSNKVVTIEFELSFVGDLVDCPTLRRLFQPDLGDLQETMHKTLVGDEPLSPLAEMLKPLELTWIETTEWIHSEKYRPICCFTDKTIENHTITKDMVISLNTGYTVYFGLTLITERVQLVLYEDFKKKLEITFTLINQEELEDIIDTDEKSRGKSPFRLYTISIKFGNNYELNIDNTKDYTGMFTSVNRRKFSDLHLAVVAHPFFLSQSGTWKQVILLYSGERQVYEAEFNAGEMYPDLQIQPNTITFYDDEKDVFGKEKAIIKVFNYALYELGGSSEKHVIRAHESLRKSCGESLTGIIYKGGAELPPMKVFSNYDMHEHFGYSGLPCSGPCESSGEKGKLEPYKCSTGEQDATERCSKEFWIPIQEKYVNICKKESGNVGYCALGLQYGETPSEEEPSALEFNAEDTVFDFGKKLTSLSQHLECTEELILTQDMANLSAKCHMASNEDQMYDRGHILAPVKLRLKPVVKWCRPQKSDPEIFNTYTRGEGYRVYRKSSLERVCPVGFREIKTVDKITCAPCPKNSYSDISSWVGTCQSCPVDKPSTYFAERASSAQCSNDQLNTMRGYFFRYDKANLSNVLMLRPTLWWNTNYTVIENLDHLKPKQEYLEAQRQAVAAFKALTQITFSDIEVFVLLVISTALAVYGGLLFLLVLMAISRPPQCPAEEFYGPKPNVWESVGLAVYCALCKVAIMVSYICRRIKLRAIMNYRKYRRSFFIGRLSYVIPRGSRRFSSIMRHQITKTKLPPLTDRQKALIHLMSEITINRIVEAALKEAEEEREKRRSTYLDMQRRRHEAGEIEALARGAEVAAEAAEREALELEAKAKDAKDSRNRVRTTKDVEQAKKHANQLRINANILRASTNEKLSALIKMEQDDLAAIALNRSRLSAEDERAIENAAPELRAYLRLPRYHTPAYFLLHPEADENMKLRETAYPAPPRDWHPKEQDRNE